VDGWRNASASQAGFATQMPGTYHFQALAPNLDSTLPEGYSFGTLTVDKKGVTTISGKLADGSAFSTTSFVGPQGQVLVYMPLYSGRGSAIGVLSLTAGENAPAENTVGGRLDWYKPASDPNARVPDTLYPGGFGPFTAEVSGSLYTAPAGTDLLLGLPAGNNNARLSFRLGGLDTAAAEFDELCTVSTVKQFAAVIVNNPVNGTVVKALAAAGTLDGTFTLNGRKATFSALIVCTRAVGYFLLPQVPEAGADPATAPKLSGQVTFEAN
jgi:hypothetical protein